MLWAYVVAGAAGFLLGLRYRVPALLMASALLMVISPAATALAVSPICQAVAVAFGALVALQFGYVAGLTLQAADDRTY